MELYIEPEIAYRKKQLDELGRFLPGHKPWNKNLKGLDIGGKETRFKKGNLPHNTKHDGAISIRTDSKSGIPYKYIRIAKAKWVLLHRYVWEQYNGQIPKGYIIRFKDGDTLNCAISNLECISRRENMKRNTNYQKSAESMRRRWASEKRRAAYGLELETKLLKRIKR